MAVNSKPLQPTAICRIIETCAKLGVSTLKWGDLEVKFTSPSLEYVGQEEPLDLSKNFTPLTEPHESVSHDGTNKSVLIDKALLEDIELSQLMLDDPMAFEQQMVDAELRRPDVQT